MKDLEGPRRASARTKRDRVREYTAEEIAQFLRDDELDEEAQAVVARFSAILARQEQTRHQEPA